MQTCFYHMFRFSPGRRLVTQVTHVEKSESEDNWDNRGDQYLIGTEEHRTETGCGGLLRAAAMKCGPSEKQGSNRGPGLGVQIPLRSRAAGNVRRIPFVRLDRELVLSCVYLHGYLREVVSHTPVKRWRRFYQRALVAVSGRLSWCVHEFPTGYVRLSTVNVQLTDHCSRSKSNGVLQHGRQFDLNLDACMASD